MARPRKYDTPLKVREAHSVAKEKYESGSVTALAKGKLNEAEGKVDNITVIFRATPVTKGNLQFGSRLIFDKKGDLFVSLGALADFSTPYLCSTSSQESNFAERLLLVLLVSLLLLVLDLALG